MTRFLLWRVTDAACCIGLEIFFIFKRKEMFPIKEVYYGSITAAFWWCFLCTHSMLCQTNCENSPIYLMHHEIQNTYKGRTIQDVSFAPQATGVCKPAIADHSICYMWVKRGRHQILFVISFSLILETVNSPLYAFFPFASFPCVPLHVILKWKHMTYSLTLYIYSAVPI